MIKISGTGRLTRDGELRYLPSGVGVLNFDVATNRVLGKNDDGSWNTETIYVRCAVWGERAERMEKQTSKGREVWFEGDFSLRSYENAAGETKTSVECRVGSVEFFGKAAEREAAERGAADDDLDADDLPF